MQYQRGAASCSAAALQNCLAVLGVRVGQHRLERLIGCTDDGADEQDILRALSAFGAAVEICATSRRADALSWLRKHAYVGPLLLCVDDWGHWVSVAGGCGPRLWLFDPVPEPWNMAQNGAWPLLPKTIVKRWRAARRHKKDGALFYGIAVLSAQRRTCSFLSDRT